MTPRRILFGLAALAVGVLVGLPIARAVWPAPPAPTLDTVRPPATPTSVQPVELGAPPSEVEVVDAPDWVAFNGQVTGVASRISPAVVYIQATIGQTGTDLYGGFEGGTTEAGSGLIISPDGYVLTNAHVVSRASRIGVGLHDKREFEAEVVGLDPTTDLAVLRLLEVGVDDPEPLPVVALGDSDDVQVGQWVLAIGSPFRLRNTVTQGIVSATGRSGLEIVRDEFAIEDFIQTDAAINPGSSGGALVDFNGQVIGVVTAIATESGSYEGYGFAVPINLARRVAEDLISYGEVRRGYLGVEVRGVLQADARELGLDRVRGVRVVEVVGGGAADQGGVKPDDVLLEVGGRAVDEVEQFQSRLAQTRPGERVELTIWREGEALELEAGLIAREATFQDWLTERDPEPVAPDVPRDSEAPPIAAAPDWGVQFRDLTPSERRDYRAGAFVEGVRPESAADIDGLPAGVIVTEIEGQAITTAEEAQVALARQARRDRPALVRVRRPDGLTAFYDLASPFVD
ncbi:MAG: trypsin-like peptidase domain-containing protein [Rubricoccaceae bacterium]